MTNLITPTLLERNVRMHGQIEPEELEEGENTEELGRIESNMAMSISKERQNSEVSETRTEELCEKREAQK